MVRIDAHQHYWRYQPQDYPWIDDAMTALRQDFGPAQLQPSLTAQRFDGAIAVQARHCEAETAWLLAQCAQAPGVRGVVGWLDITAPDIEEQLARWRLLLCGLRHQAQDEPDPAAWLARNDVAQGMRQLQRQGYAWDLLVTHRHLEAGARFAARHDEHWIVLDHFGKPDIARGAAHWAEQVKPLAALPHVVCKLSGLVTEAPGYAWRDEQLWPFFDAALALFGPERLMFGSDWPVCLLAAEYAQVYALCDTAFASLSSSERAAIWGETACRVYGLTEAQRGSVSE
ncbi:L-fuconolactone hydrolase [Cronobacter condimenti 1330]|uniref:Amidohydrolase n=1 Tax=Cronobacter condimenti 1330 TaxID=1073999 RepID=K8A015_9ENTR|nr:amidohydrolase family protein [Cronobacter condimenti]ALB64394.1 amidohydrolase [Cronobacter condimenti 1330]CCJ72538.1 L-fuconolactone hydrolase [Cronobacter condimenti 1330]